MTNNLIVIFKITRSKKRRWSILTKISNQIWSSLITIEKVVVPHWFKREHQTNMHQPDLTNLPSTPLNYQKEIKNGYLPPEDAENLAHPRLFSPIQQLHVD